jgi:hypothetical protein
MFSRQKNGARVPPPFTAQKKIPVCASLCWFVPVCAGLCWFVPFSAAIRFFSADRLLAPFNREQKGKLVLKAPFP